MGTRYLRSLVVCLGLALGLGLAVRPALAVGVPVSQVKWTLNGIFCDGGGFSGYVVVDYWGQNFTGMKSLDNWDITVTPPVGSNLQGVTFTPSSPNATASLTGDPLFDVFAGDPFHLEWSVNSLFAYDGTIQILAGTFTSNPPGFYQDDNGNCDCIQGGTMTPSVPEPASLALLGTGALLLLGLALRQRRHPRAA